MDIIKYLWLPTKPSDGVNFDESQIELFQSFNPLSYIWKKIELECLFILNYYFKIMMDAG